MIRRVRVGKAIREKGAIAKCRRSEVPPDQSQTSLRAIFLLVDGLDASQNDIGKAPV